MPYNFSAGFDHAHNSFTHTGIELGGVGFLLWVGVWLLAFFFCMVQATNQRGQLALGTLLVAVVALQFDTGSQWETLGAGERDCGCRLVW